MKSIHFLKHGNKFFILSLFLLLCSCHEDTEYLIKADFSYVNNSVHTVEISGPPFIGEYLQKQGKEHLILLPADSVNIHVNTDGVKITGPVDYNGFLKIHSIVLKYDGTLIDTLEVNSGRSINDIRNYTTTKIQSAYYSFIYYFTDKDFEDAK